MANLSGIVQQLRKERDRVERQLSGLNAAISAFVGVYNGAGPTRKRRKFIRRCPKEDQPSAESPMGKAEGWQSTSKT